MRQIMKLAVLWLAASPLLDAAEYRYVKIHVPGSVDTRANGINARGDIVGFFTDFEGVTHGYLRRNGRFFTVDVPGAKFTSAFSVNARGDIVGRYVDADDNGHGYLFSDGEFTRIDYPGAAETEARGINNAGDIAGRFFTRGGLEIGFMLKDGRFQTIRVPGSCATQASMAQDNGRVLVGHFCSTPDGALHAFMRNRSGEFRSIDFPSGGSFPCTGARSVNERGDVVGPYSVADNAGECGPGNSRGYVFRDGKFVAIDFPGATLTFPGGINNYGTIVGLYIDQAGVSHGFKAIPVAVE